MRSIQTKLTVIILLISFGALITLGGLNYWKARELLYTSIVNEMKTLAVNSAGDVNDWLESHKREVAALAVMPTLQTGDMEQIKPFLTHAAKANGRYAAFGFVNSTGIGSDSNGVSINLSTREYIQRALRGEHAISEPVVSPATGGLVVVFASPVKLSDGKVVGIFFGSIELGEVSQKISEVKIGTTGYAYMLKGDGVTIANPNKELVMKDNPLKNEKLPLLLRQTSERMVKGETGVTTYEYNGVQKMVAYAPVQSSGWSLAVSLPMSEALDGLTSLTWISLATIVTVLIITAMIVAWFARRIAKPINALETAATRIATGDISLNKLEINSNDEIGRLGHSFEQMTLNLRTLIQKILGATEQLAASSQELTASSEQSAQAANQVATSITDVSEGVNEQLQAARETTIVVEQMATNINQIAANANKVASDSSKAADKAKNGDAAIERAVIQMNQIEGTVNSSAQVVAKLGERSKEIGQIVDTISGIAGQTNLLALNAAIEAARAGEQGRGFAVVADEVRKLAEQSQEAAKKIGELIGEIQGDTDKAVVAMNDGTREVKTGAEVVNTAGTAFREINVLVNEVSSQVKEISTAMQQLAAGSQQIVNSVKKIDELGKNSAGEAQSVSAAAEEQLASMEEIASSSQALAKLAEDLQTSVAGFRV